MLYQPKNLLTVDTNAKTVKGQKYGFLTGILYMAPSDMSGHQFCPMAKLAGCEAGCLNTAGRGAMSSVQRARLNKAYFFIQQREAFMRMLAEDIRRLVRRAKKLGMTPLVRLNGTSDIRWENVRDHMGLTIFQRFPEVQFYDYTKIANRRDIPANYDLTFSWSGHGEFPAYAQRAIGAGMRVAVVFRDRGSIPADFMGMRTVDGDDSDIRHLDPRGVVVALYAKGKAKRDTSGFVVDRVIPIKLAA
jgi:hypothetical protein